MKKKLLVAIMAISVTLCGAFGFSGCDISEFLDNMLSGKTENEQNGNTHDTEQNNANEWGMPVENSTVTCGYEFAFDKTLDRYAVHRGMDFKAKAGNNVLAVKKGTVTKVVTNHILNENFVTVTHDGGITSIYKYIVANENLKEGDNVERGDVIGIVAEAGGMEMMEGAHLHFEMSVNGRTVDPNIYLNILEKNDGDIQYPDDDNYYYEDIEPGDNTQDPSDEQIGEFEFILPLENATVIYGYEFKFDKTLIRYAVHQGIDFQAPAGTEVFAAAGGTITKIVTDHILNENYVTITHSNGITTTYKYIVAKEGLKAGDVVKQGDIIGTIAPAGGMEMNDGDHLHFEMRVNERTIDPAPYLGINEEE